MISLTIDLHDSHFEYVHRQHICHLRSLDNDAQRGGFMILFFYSRHSHYTQCARNVVLTINGVKAFGKERMETVLISLESE